MISRQRVLYVFFMIISFFPVFYLLSIWNDIPETVPLHFDSKFRPDRYGSRQELLLGVSILSWVALLSYFIFRNIYRIDRRRTKYVNPGIFHALAGGITVFIALIGVGLVAATVQGQSALLARLIFPLVGILFLFLGFSLRTIRPNYFAGFRTPWALEDDRNWRRTHLFGGSIWIVGGGILLLSGFILPLDTLGIAFIVLLVLMILLPVGYSFFQFRQKQHD